jgi:CBS domain-containing protein
MTSGFDAQNPPFDRLSQPEIEDLRAAIDIGYFRPGERIIAAGESAEHLHVLIKGSVEERQGDTVLAVLGPKDSFDSRALVHGAAGDDFVAAEETLCHLIPKDAVRRLIARNPAFAAFFYSEMSRKLDAFAASQKAEGVESFLRARVREAMQPGATFVAGDLSIGQTGARMRDADRNALFVLEGGRTGVVTGMNLAKAVVLRGLALDSPVREACHFDVIAVEADDFIFDALITMTRHNKRRVAVRERGDYVGFLEDIDILGLVAGNSQLIPGRIDRAHSVAELAAPAREIQAQVERLHRQGIKVDAIAEITSDLNRRLFVKLFELLAPPAIREQGCLFLMGSEGRGEQTVRTDQDNGLLLAGAVPQAELDAFRTAFSGALAEFGFPPCPGEVMVRNPLWSQDIEGMERQIRSWVMERTPEAAMNIAIFADADAVTGRPELLARAKAALVELLKGEQVLLARFAHLIETFDTPDLGVLSSIMQRVGVGSEEIDLKRAGTFPIVHGVRVMAIDRGVTANSTEARIAALAQPGGPLEAGFGRELLSALRVFMEFRLRAQLEAVRRGSVVGESLIRPSRLSSGDRDLLRDALRIVRSFREQIRLRYNLGAF